MKKTLQLTNLKFLAYIIAFLFFSNINVQAQDEPDTTVNLSTPRKTVHTHLINLQEEYDNPAKAAKTLNIENQDSKRAKEIAEKLFKVFNGKALYVKLNDIPDEPNYSDSETGNHKYVLFDELPQVYLVKKGEIWLYSKETVQAIPELYEATFPVDEERLREILPEFTFNKFLGLYLWQYFGIIIYAALALVLFYVLTKIFGYYLIRIMRRTQAKEMSDRYIKPLARPLSWLIIFSLLSLLLPILDLPIKLNLVFSYAFRALIPFFATMVVYRLTDLIADIFDTVASKTKTTVDDNLVPFARKALKFFVIGFGAIFILENVNIPITPLIAGISIGGLAFALAAQDTVKNLFGSVTIFADQPFEVGDWIVFDGNEGMVEEVGIRSTRVRTFYNSLVSIPNGKLSDIVIDNMGRRQYRRYFTKISLTYDTPTDKFEAFVKGLREIVLAHPSTRKDYFQVHLYDFSAYSIDVLFYIFFNVPDWTAELEARHDMNREIIKCAEAVGVRFAFPTSTVHVENFPNTESLTPKHEDPNNILDEKVEDFKRYLLTKYNKEGE